MNQNSAKPDPFPVPENPPRASGSENTQPIRYLIEHLTRYSYSQSASISRHLAHLRPLSLPHQNVINFQLTVDPVPTILTHDIDYFGNATEAFAIEEPHARVEIITRSEVEVAFVAAVEDEATAMSWEKSCAAVQPAIEYTFASPAIPVGREFADYARNSFTADRPLLDAAMDFTRRINDEFTFDNSATTISTPVSEVMKNKRGVCQDFAHLQIACLRSLGIAARYVSGYIRTNPPPGRPRLAGTDATHAWVSIYSPAHQAWIDYDPTNHCMALNDHVRVAYGRDFRDVSPVRGTYVGGGSQHLAIAVTMQPADEDGPLTKSQNQSQTQTQSQSQSQSQSQG